MPTISVPSFTSKNMLNVSSRGDFLADVWESKVIFGVVVKDKVNNKEKISSEGDGVVTC